MLWVGFDEFTQGGDGFIFFALGPLAVCEEKHGTGGGSGAGVAIDDSLKGSEVSSFAKVGTGAFLAAVLDAAIDDGTDGGNDKENGKSGDAFLIAVEKCLERVGSLGDFGEGSGGFFEVGGHVGKIQGLRKHDQSGTGVEINAEVRKFSGFRAGVRGGGDFIGQREAGCLIFAGMSKRVYVVAGELSGDAHGAGLLRSLREMVPDLEIQGVGGPEMAEIAGSGLKDWVEDAAVMGVWEVLKRYGWFKQRFAEMLADLKRFKPDVLLLIDYPGFNLRFAEAVKRECPGTRIIYYISPKVWAWNKKRIPVMARLLDEMLCLFPFEQPILEKAGLKTTFVGNPLVDELEEKRIPDVRRDELLVGLFPGSREREIARLFPMMIDTAKRLKTWKFELKFEVPAASAKLAEQIRGLMADAGAGDLIAVTNGGSHSLMQRACCAVIASGTATLEAGYYGLPYCLVYRTAPLTYVLARLLVKIEYIGLVNILAGKGVVEELIQGKAEPEAVSRSLRKFLESPEKRHALQTELAETSALLGGKGAHERAARAVAEWLRRV
jgi:lipid-A-disaccharide synthase